jgi:hypothetical protein
VPDKPEAEIDLADFLLGPDDEPPTRRRKKRHERAGSLQPLPGAFVRVPIHWISRPRRGEYLYRPRERLFLYLLYRSHWGQRGVPLTSAFLEAINIERRYAYRLLDQLEAKGRVRIERREDARGRPLVVRPIVLTD